MDDGKEGVIKSFRDAQPTHYTFKIKSFSLLSKSSIERHETATFEVAGYNWKLCLYPKGNGRKNVREHISFYLVISDTNTLPPSWDVNVIFRLFLFDQVRDRYLTVQDINETGRHFHWMKTEWGFDQFIDLKTFNDPSGGYLVDDVCVFGAEVFVCKERSKCIGECLSMIKGVSTCKHTWKIDNILDDDSLKECLMSEAFMAGNHQWKIQLYPNGTGEGKGNSVSLFLALADFATLTPAQKLYVDYTLRLVDQNQKHLREFTCNQCFSASSYSWGLQKFLQFIHIGNKKNICMVEAEVTIVGEVDKLP